MRPGARTALQALAAYAATYGVLWALDFGPHPLPLLLLLVLGWLVWRLVHRALDAPAAEWDAVTDGTSRPAGQDAVLSGYLRVLQSHVDSRTPDPALRERLLSLGRARLEARLGVPPDGRTVDERLGPDWAALRADPDRHLSVAQIDRLLRRIEEL